MKGGPYMNPVLFFIIFAVIAVPVILFAKKKLEGGINKYDVRSTGKIVDKKPYEKNRTVFYVLLEYEYEGKQYREYTRNAAGPGPWNNYLEIGSESRIYINSSDPTDVYCGKHIHGMGLKTGR